MYELKPSNLLLAYAFRSLFLKCLQLHEDDITVLKSVSPSKAFLPKVFNRLFYDMNLFTVIKYNVVQNKGLGLCLFFYVFLTLTACLNNMLAF